MTRTLSRWPVAAAAVAVVLMSGLASPPIASAAVAPPTVVAVSAGVNHACALTEAGGVKCWGRNTYGQLGDGTTTDAFTPVDVGGVGVATAIAVGLDHTCALTDAGGVKCWGRNSIGQLGDGTHKRSVAPIDVPTLTSGVTAIAAGANDTCALLATGGVQCWGQNDSGQLGDNTLLAKASPTDVATLTAGVQAISASASHTCAVMLDGTAKCWGANLSSQLGDGTTKRAKVPVDVVGLTSADAITAGQDHTCALTDAGAVLCWGSNKSGQIGDGTTKSRRAPTPVFGLTGGALGVSAATAHTCAVTGGGQALCWGGNAVGQLGSGGGAALKPAAVVGMASGVASVSASGEDTCAVTAAGSARCWGGNSNGQIGDSTRGRLAQRRVPMTVWGLTGGGTESFRPDLLLARAVRGPFVGDNRYNATGAKQTLKLRVSRGGVTRGFARLQSDGSANDIVFLQGTGFGNSRSAVRTACRVGRADATAAVASGVAWARVATTRAVRLSFSIAAKKAAALGASHVITVLARSSHDPTKVDVIRLVVTVVR
jgi:alpha-tubulin suppressor-like RCC1 family protein